MKPGSARSILKKVLLYGVGIAALSVCYLRIANPLNNKYAYIFQRIVVTFVSGRPVSATTVGEDRFTGKVVSDFGNVYVFVNGKPAG